jgi:hypothetical protein
MAGNVIFRGPVGGQPESLSTRTGRRGVSSGHSVHGQRHGAHRRCSSGY